MITFLPKEFNGVMYISGDRGVGKSYLASQSDFPQNIFFVDFENKGEGIHEQLNFGKYCAPNQATSKGNKPDPMAMYDYTMAQINSLPQDKFTVAVLDNISWLEQSLKAEAVRNLDEYCRVFNLNKKNVIANRFGGVSPIVNNLISSNICAPLHAKGVRLIIAISHVGNVWGGAGPIPNKSRIKGADRWQELSILTLVLTHGDVPKIPAALVRKEQLGSISIPDPSTMTSDEVAAYMRGEFGHEIKPRLPLRIPQCTFQSIRNYLIHPADINNPAEGERPTDAQVDRFSENLNKSQLYYVRLAMEVAAKEERKADEQFAEFEAENNLQEEIANLMAVENFFDENPDASPLEASQTLEMSVPDILKYKMKISQTE